MSIFSLESLLTSYYFSYEKNWESTYRLTDTTSVYPKHIDPSSDIVLDVNYSGNVRHPGHLRQMIAEGKTP